MMRARLLALAAFGLVTACASAKSAQREGMPLEDQPLASEPLSTPAPMQVVSLPSEQPTVSFRLVFHSGSVDDPPGREGLTQLAAAVMAEGGTKSLTSAQLLSALYPIAGELSVAVDKELTTFEGRVHKDHLEKFLKIFTDVLLEPRWDAREFERLKTDAINALRNGLRGEDDESLGKVALDAVLYPSHPYWHSTGGTVSGLSQSQLEDAKVQAKGVFTQDRLVIGLAGAVDDALVEKVKKRLSALPAKGKPRVEWPKAPGVHGHVRIMKKNSMSTAISMGFAVPVRRGHPDFFPLAFALSYLGQHRQFAGVLFTELREKRGLNYGDYAYPEHFIQLGQTTFPETNIARRQQDISIWLRPVEPAHALFAARGALYFLHQLSERGFPRDKFETMRGFLQGYTRLWEQTDQQRLGYAIDDLFYGTSHFLDSYRQAMAQLTPEQVQAVLRRYVRPENFNFVFVAEKAEALAEDLSKGRVSPIQYQSPKPQEVLDVDKEILSFPLPVKASAISIQDAQTFMEAKDASP